VSLEGALRERLRGRVTVVGIGNPLRADDAVGGLVAGRLRPGPGLHVIDAEEVPESHLGPVTATRPDTILLVDAVDLGAPAGSLALVGPGDLDRFTPTSHRVPLEVLARWLAAETGARVFLLAVQPARTGVGEAVSAEVAAAALLAADILNRALSQRRDGLPC